MAATLFLRMFDAMNFHKFLPLSLVLVSACVAAHGQKKQFSIAEATNGMTTTLAPKSIKQASFRPGTNELYSVAGTTWVRNDPRMASVDTFLSLKELNTNIFGKDSLKAAPAYTWLNNNEVWMQQDNIVYKGNVDQKRFSWRKWYELPADAENVHIDKTSGNMAYTIGNNLFFRKNGGAAIRVSNDADKNMLNGQSVHRNEFGIEGGIFFSPKGNYLAYYRMDQTMVNDYPVVDWSTTPAKNTDIKYPMAGGTSHQVTVQVFDPATGKSVALQTGEPKDQYLTCVTWSPDERHVYVALLNRDQNHLWLNQYDARTGAKLATLFEETSDRYVEPQHPLSFLPGSNDQFLWWSQRDGFMHLYVYNIRGKLIRQLTKGNWLVNELVGFNAKKNEVIITASKESPLEKHVYVVNYNNGRMRRLDTEPGVHTALANDDGSCVFDVVTGPGIPKRSVLRNTDGKSYRVLLDAPDPLKDYERPVIRDVMLKADDGTDLYGKLILPTGFDSTRKYPVVVYLYNGPHVQLVRNSFPESNNLWYEYMAQRGYIMFIMDGRGSSNRGLAFESVTFRQLGTVEMNDQLKGTEYLKSLPYVDAERMGVHGWSFGGFMTTSLMMRHPGVFKCAVAGGPVIDWKMYEVMYTERYMDTPEQNPKGYEEANLLSKVKGLKGRLLLIHGTNDDVVVWQHSLNLLKKSVDEGVQLDYFVYPGHLHNVRGKDRVHLMQKITDYFDLYLKP